MPDKTGETGPTRAYLAVCRVTSEGDGTGVVLKGGLGTYVGGWGVEVEDHFVLCVTTIIGTTSGSWDRLASFRTGHPRSSGKSTLYNKKK